MGWDRVSRGGGLTRRAGEGGVERGRGAGGPPALRGGLISVEVAGAGFKIALATRYRRAIRFASSVL